MTPISDIIQFLEEQRAETKDVDYWCDLTYTLGILDEFKSDGKTHVWLDRDNFIHPV